MGNELGKNHIAVTNDNGELEVIDLITGQIVETSNVIPAAQTYNFDYGIALLICQEVRRGRTITSFEGDSRFPPAHIISHWVRTERMFAAELALARRDRADHFFDKVIDEAIEVAKGGLGRDDISAKKLAIDSFKWIAEKAAPDKYGQKVTHEGNAEKPILMRVVNTGINRAPAPIVEAEVINKGTTDVSKTSNRDEDN